MCFMFHRAFYFLLFWRFLAVFSPVFAFLREKMFEESYVDVKTTSRASVRVYASLV